ncbi:MAG: glycosyltransferase, partial [Bacteroidetes bacterium]|nr:glycosyltransferase [Bacteroidota bacterium]
LQYSISEGFCNAVLEAQAMGLLCVVSDGGALSENVLHEKTGWIVPKRKPKALAEAIMKVIHLPKEEKEKVRNNANERVIESFNLIKQQQEFIEFYE